MGWEPFCDYPVRSGSVTLQKGAKKPRILSLLMINGPLSGSGGILTGIGVIDLPRLGCTGDWDANHLY